MTTTITCTHKPQNQTKCQQLLLLDAMSRIIILKTVKNKKGERRSLSKAFILSFPCQLYLKIKIDGKGMFS